MTEGKLEKRILKETTKASKEVVGGLIFSKKVFEILEDAKKTFPTEEMAKTIHGFRYAQSMITMGVEVTSEDSVFRELCVAWFKEWFGDKE